VPEQNVGIVTGQLVAGGIDILQLRAEGCLESRIASLALAMLPITKRAGVPLIVNDYPDLLREEDADGCNVGQEDLVSRRRVILQDVTASLANQLIHSNKLSWLNRKGLIRIRSSISDRDEAFCSRCGPRSSGFASSKNQSPDLLHWRGETWKPYCVIYSCHDVARRTRNLEAGRPDAHGPSECYQPDDYSHSNNDSSADGAQAGSVKERKYLTFMKAFLHHGFSPRSLSQSHKVCWSDGLVGIALALTILQSQMFFTGALNVTQILTVPRLKPMLTVSATPSVCLKWPYISIWRALTSSWWLIVARKP
jgi:hypothetical protein